MKSRLVLLAGLVLGVPVSAMCGSQAPDPGRMPEVLSYEVIDVAAFNQEVAAAVKAGASWPREAMQVVLRRVGVRDEIPGRFVLAMENPQIENPRVLKVTALAEGLLDDSISGEWIHLELEKSSDGTWRLTQEHRAWRCARGEGIGTYEKAHCP